MNSSHKRHGLNPEWVSDEQGQGMTELMIGTILLMLLVIAVYEMAQAFRVYQALENAAREGALYASLDPQEFYNQSGVGDMRDCADTECGTYVNRVKQEFLAVGLDTDQDYLKIPPPTITSGLGANCPVTGTVTFYLTTFSSQIALPLLGRMGLPSVYKLSYSVGMPIRTPAIDPTTDNEYPACH